MPTRRKLLAASAIIGTNLLAESARQARAASLPAWSDIERNGRGQPVFWNAWGGDDPTNAFIAWTGEKLRVLHDVTVHHVKLRDTSEAVARVVAEKAAGRDTGGSVDLIWINGPNFLAMKQQNLLLGPVLEALPHAGLIDRVGKPTTLTDFTVPTDGFEAPWRMARVVFVYDSARLAKPPLSMTGMLAWSLANPGRLTHPTVSNFLGATFLKQALVELASDRSALQAPATDVNFATATAPLWQWYASLRPSLWRGGKNFPESGPAQTQLLNDSEIDLMISFNPNEAASGIAQGTLPSSARAYSLNGGTIGNCSFVAVPYNAAHMAASLLLADFLLSPEAQARATDPTLLGSPTVLALDRLSAADRRLFTDLPRPVGSLTEDQLGAQLPEPHPSWMTRIAAEWERVIVQ